MKVGQGKGGRPSSQQSWRPAGMELMMVTSFQMLSMCSAKHQGPYSTVSVLFSISLMRKLRLPKGLPPVKAPISSKRWG